MELRVSGCLVFLVHVIKIGNLCSELSKFHCGGLEVKQKLINCFKKED